MLLPKMVPSWSPIPANKKPKSGIPKMAYKIQKILPPSVLGAMFPYPGEKEWREKEGKQWGGRESRALTKESSEFMFSQALSMSKQCPLASRYMNSLRVSENLIYLRNVGSAWVAFLMESDSFLLRNITHHGHTKFPLGLCRQKPLLIVSSHGIPFAWSHCIQHLLS